MDFLRHYLLTILLLLPAAGAIAVLFVRGNAAIRWTALGIALGTFVASLLLLLAFDWHAGDRYAYADDGGVVQLVQRVDWIPALHVQYLVGVDGLGVPLVILTTLISVLACIASWNAGISSRYFALLLLLETSILGVFVSLDFFLFFLFFELMLLPIFLLGGFRRAEASGKFLLYSLVGSICLLIVLIQVYLISRVMPGGATLDLVKLAGPEFAGVLRGESPALARGLFFLALAGFLVKLPAFPLHGWLGDLLADAPTPLAMMIAGLVLPAGGYGVLRIAYPIFPEVARSHWMIVASWGALSIVYGSLCAMAQKDFRRMIAFSLMSLMGFVLLGAAMMNEAGLNGAVFMLLAVGIVGAAMIFIAGVIFERTRHGVMSRLGGLAARMPVGFGLSIVGFFAALGLPGLCGFVAEMMVILGCFGASRPGSALYLWAGQNGRAHQLLVVSWTIAIVIAFSLVLTAGYLLLAIQRIFLGAPRPEHREITDLDAREILVLTPLVVLILLLGILPMVVLAVTNQTVLAILSRWSAGG
jgi:NADH-quinone oxidoreductase subunit M